ncbi:MULTISPECIES: TetR/AcrR family transcriptional regulator [unclassified Dyella]|uniref:TetR/AcrR family transcriptional regulator n=1 Tax=unclassified Dyella TaxID=2634549 RepID=UPI000C863981|nr:MULTISPECIES: TetR/AcrR family transcriptional regulator [unclassified Dyella]MDR3447677.1 TetR/AcrR family transcriptional regulator [Dyella sp.]PMQ05338.1 HTH-type transcriptional regulator TtgR [Dyella sp. AD56]
MGVSKQQAIENKKAIVAAAEKLFRERGVAAVGLAELTKAAGFTQGGFYNHFKSKDALVDAVMDKAMEDGAALLVSGIEASKEGAVDPMQQYVEWYLSSDHRGNIEAGCPLTAFAGDVRRLGTEARQAYAQGLEWNVDQLAKMIGGENAQANREKAIALFSQMVGSLVLSRAVAEANPTLADEILKDGRQPLLQAMR